jgi:hypothetical protein
VKSAIKEYLEDQRIWRDGLWVHSSQFTVRNWYQP